MAKIISQEEESHVRTLLLEVFVNGKTIFMKTEFEGHNCLDMIESDKTNIWNSLSPEEKEEVRDAINAYYPD